MANDVLTVATATLKEMKNYYQDYLKPTTPPGALFAAKKSSVNITGYNSGKVLFQGSSAEQEAHIWKSKATTTLPSKKALVKNQSTRHFLTDLILGPLSEAMRWEQAVTLVR